MGGPSSGLLVGAAGMEQERRRYPGPAASVPRFHRPDRRRQQDRPLRPDVPDQRAPWPTSSHAGGDPGRAVVQQTRYPKVIRALRPVPRPPAPGFSGTAATPLATTARNATINAGPPAATSATRSAGPNARCRGKPPPPARSRACCSAPYRQCGTRRHQGRVAGRPLVMSWRRLAGSVLDHYASSPHGAGRCPPIPSHTARHGASPLRLRGARAARRRRHGVSGVVLSHRGLALVPQGGSSQNRHHGQ